MYISRLSANDVYVSDVSFGIHLAWHSGMWWLVLKMTENGHTAVVSSNTEINPFFSFCIMLYG